MKKIVGLIKPFDLKQNFYVYEDGNKIDTALPKIDEIGNTVLSLADKYNITQVDLVGSKQFNKGLRKKLQEEEMTKFNSNKLTINIL